MNKTLPRRRPKLMTKEELAKCSRVTGWAEDELRRRVGIPVRAGRKRVKPENFTLQQTRCIRYLAMNETFRKKAEEVIKFFPNAEILSLRPTKR